jgi:hypothetical protein
MSKGLLPEDSHHINEDMWKMLMSIRVTAPSELMAQDHALSELSQLTLHRRARLLQSTYSMPSIYWCVLLTGGALTVLSVSMFGSANSRVHFMQVFSLTLLITLVMLAIADVDRPYRGWVHISSHAFERAEQTMHEVR